MPKKPRVAKEYKLKWSVTVAGYTLAMFKDEQTDRMAITVKDLKTGDIRLLDEEPPAEESE